VPDVQQWGRDALGDERVFERDHIARQYAADERRDPDHDDDDHHDRHPVRRAHDRERQHAPVVQHQHQLCGWGDHDDAMSGRPEVRCACGAWVLACWTMLITSTGSHATTGCDPRDVGTANPA
jgi:hypothetical protein